MTTTKGLVIAIVLIPVTIALALLFPKPKAPEFYALVLFAIAAVYLGFAISDGRGLEAFIEIANLTFFLALAILGILVSPYFLIAGFFAHGIWDAVHHRRVGLVKTKVPEWYVYSCVFYDWIVGGILLWWWR